MKITRFDVLFFVIAVGFSVICSFYKISTTSLGYKLANAKKQELELLEKQSVLNSKLAQLAKQDSLRVLAEQGDKQTLAGN